MADLITADLFAGGGGTSTGLAQACHKLSKKPELTAVNHWDIAIETHRRNHPWARHLCTGLDQIHPAALYPKGRIDLLVASPECIHHSNARGGKPMSDQSRSSPWLVLKWLQDLYVDAVLIENVPEFEEWGPLGADARPLKSKRGASFTAWVETMRSMGYNVDWRVINTADHGDATVRRRLFVQAKRGRNKKIYWPDATHFQNPEQGDLFRSSQARWKAAREIIDWTMPSQSIFGRKKPLAPATIERIAAGLRKFGGAAAEPFLVVLRNHADYRPVDLPLPTVTAGGRHIGLCQPFVTTAGGPEGQGRNPHSVHEPLPTVLTDPRFCVVEPFVMTLEHSKRFVIPTNHGRGDHRTYSMEKPMPTITTVDAWGMVEPMIVKYYGTSEHAKPVDSPLDTVTSKSRFGLVEFEKGKYLDIHFRMLHWRELAAATGFPKDYDFAGNREEIVKQIGNAVPIGTARALCETLIQ